MIATNMVMYFTYWLRTFIITCCQVLYGQKLGSSSSSEWEVENWMHKQIGFYRSLYYLHVVYK